ncbi:hypothetical protein GGI17_000908 [Coemansia sp. S146]|nr:hypothetical protein GGI17_000908 [Coemansia sp. S146]
MTDNSTPVDLVFSNTLLLGRIADYLKQSDLARLCQTHKLGWQTIIPRLWKSPQLHTIKNIEAFSRSVGIALPYTMGAFWCYGYLVQVLGVSEIYTRPYTLTYDLLAPVLKHCLQVKVLNLKRCRNLCSNDFRNLFLSSPLLCSSLTYLNIARMSPIISHVKVVFKQLPSVKQLILNRTNINNAVLVIVSKSMPDLEHLEIVKCGRVTNVAIQARAKGCPKLAYLQTRRCQHIHNTGLLQQIGARGGPVHVYDDSGSDEEYSDYYDYGSDDDEY